MNLCILCLDALREDHVTPEIMPYLHGLAEAGTRYHNVTCKTAWTLSSVAAMLMGDDDAFKRGPRIGQPSLATLLSPTHDTAAFFGQGALWPTPEIAWLWESFDSTWSYMQAEDWIKSCRQMDEVWEQFFAWRNQTQQKGVWCKGDRMTAEHIVDMRPHKRGGGPWFAYIHLFEVHEPYTTDPIKVGIPQTIENGYFTNRVDLKTGRIDATEEEQASLRQAYVDYCRATDEKLSHFIPQVLDGETILFVVTDHGDSHGDCGVWGHGTGEPWQTDAARKLFWAAVGPGIDPQTEMRLFESNAILPGLVTWILQSPKSDEVDTEAVKQRLADLGYLGGG